MPSNQGVDFLTLIFRGDWLIPKPKEEAVDFLQ